jgi:hypothetical protein
MVFLQPSCWVPCTPLFFFLDLWRDPYGFRYFVLYGFQLCCAISCGLVPACGFAVVWRSSRNLHGFGDFSPTLGRIQPLSSIKHLPVACSNLSCYETYCREDRAIPRTFLATIPFRDKDDHSCGVAQVRIFTWMSYSYYTSSVLDYNMSVCFYLHWLTCFCFLFCNMSVCSDLLDYNLVVF